MAKAKTQSAFTFVGHGKTSRPGVHAKTKTSKNKRSKNAIVLTHTHDVSSSVTDPGHSHGVSPSGIQGYNPSAGGSAGQYNGGEVFQTISTNSNTTGISVSTTITSTGSSGTDANLQPYITVYMWKRTA